MFNLHFREVVFYVGVSRISDGIIHNVRAEEDGILSSDHSKAIYFVGYIQVILENVDEYSTGVIQLFVSKKI